MMQKRALNNGAMDFVSSKRARTMSVFDAATYIFWKTKEREHKISVDKLKLQKLLYYMQGYSLALLDRPLFSAEIIHYSYGPYIREVNEAFPSISSNPKADLPLHNEDKQLIDDVLDLKKNFTGMQLVDQSHFERPWMGTETSEVMTHDILKSFFSEWEQKLPLLLLSHRALPSDLGMTQFIPNKALDMLLPWLDDQSKDIQKEAADFLYPRCLDVQYDVLPTLYARDWVRKHVAVAARYHHPRALYHLSGILGFISDDDENGKYVEKCKKSLETVAPDNDYVLRSWMTEDKEKKKTLLSKEESGQCLFELGLLHKNESSKQIEYLDKSVQKGYSKAVVARSRLMDSTADALAFLASHLKGKDTPPDILHAVGLILKDNPDLKSTKGLETIDPITYFEKAGDGGMTRGYQLAAEMTADSKTEESRSKATVILEALKKYDPVGDIELGKLWKHDDRKKALDYFKQVSDISLAYPHILPLVQDEKEREEWIKKLEMYFNDHITDLLETAGLVEQND